MTPLDIFKAFGVAFATLVITLAASFPMVAFYAYLIEPGHPQEFYTEAAQWIAPWSSYILGPLVFFGFNYWLARHKPQRTALLFAVATIVAYVLIELATLSFMEVGVSELLTLGAGFWLAVKLIGAIFGACLGARLGPRAASLVL